MLSTKKTNPAEFLLNNYLHRVASTPQNYFEHLRLELFLQKLLFWFFNKYGLVFFISQFKMRDYFFLVQFYYYKTYLVLPFKEQSMVGLLRIAPKVDIVAAAKARCKGLVWQHFGLFFWKILYGYSRLQASLAYKKKRMELTLLKVATQQKKFFNRRPLSWRLFEQTKPVVKRSYNGGQQSFFFFSMFFNYFFQHWFQVSSILLYKPLLSYLLVLPFFKKELDRVVLKTEYLVKEKWHFDLLFLFNSAVVLNNFTFFLPFFTVHWLNKYQPLKHLYVFINLIEHLFMYNQDVRGVKLVMVGPFTGHGRTKTFSYLLGYMDYNSYDSRVLYDMVHSPTYYGMISLKIWITFKQDAFYKTSPTRWLQKGLKMQ